MNSRPTRKMFSQDWDWGMNYNAWIDCKIAGNLIKNCFGIILIGTNTSNVRIWMDHSLTKHVKKKRKRYYTTSRHAYIPVPTPPSCWLNPWLGWYPDRRAHRRSCDPRRFESPGCSSYWRAQRFARPRWRTGGQSCWPAELSDRWADSWTKYPGHRQQSRSAARRPGHRNAPS